MDKLFGLWNTQIHMNTHEYTNFAKMIIKIHYYYACSDYKVMSILLCVAIVFVNLIASWITQ